MLLKSIFLYFEFNDIYLNIHIITCKLNHMEIKSKAFGKQKIDSELTITFPNGIPGFEDQTHFQLFQQENSDVVFLLQSIDDDNVAFSVAHPTHFNINYNFILSDKEEAILKLGSTDDLLILLILHSDDEEPSPTGQPAVKGSIKSPLLINTKTRLGFQKSLSAVEQSITLTEKSNEIELSEI